MSPGARNSLILIAALLVLAGASYLAMSHAAPAPAAIDVNVTAPEPATAPAAESATAAPAPEPAATAAHCYALVQQWRSSSYYDLSVDTEFRVEDGLGGYNIVRIKNGAVEVTEANCPDQVCVYSLPLSEPGYGGLIACMPHALYITVVTIDEVPEDLR